MNLTPSDLPTFPISMIVACTKNYVIGREGGLPWVLKDDLRSFKKITLGKKIIMGRKTFESIIQVIGKPLPGRESYVLTRDVNFKAAGAQVFHDLPKLLKALSGMNPEGEVIVAGGAEIYRQFLPLANKIYLTKINAILDGDAFFEELDPKLWALTGMQECSKNDENQYDFKVMEFQRKFKENSDKI